MPVVKQTTILTATSQPMENPINGRQLKIISTIIWRKSINTSVSEWLFLTPNEKFISYITAIHGRVLKELNEQVAPILTSIFSKSLKSGEIPTDWKQANVAPAFKKGE